MKKAVALGYNRQIDPAPMVLAKGGGLLADRIEAIARENEIPLIEDSKLTESLMDIELQQWIPEEFYQVVSEIISFVYGLKR